VNTFLPIFFDKRLPLGFICKDPFSGNIEFLPIGGRSPAIRRSALEVLDLDRSLDETPLFMLNLVYEEGVPSWIRVYCSRSTSASFPRR
jgi:hypothetical protein